MTMYTFATPAATIVWSVRICCPATWTLSLICSEYTIGTALIYTLIGKRKNIARYRRDVESVLPETQGECLIVWAQEALMKS